MKIADANLCVLDCETTGLDYAGGDRIVQVAVVRVKSGDRLSVLVNPGRTIPATASAVHQITDEDVEHAFPIETIVPNLRRFLEPDAVLFAHNAPFDASFLPQLADYRWCCTKRLAQKLVPNAPNFQNQVLRFHLKLDSDALRGLKAHEALGDALVTTALLRLLIARYLEAGYEDDVDAFLAFAAAPIAYTHLPFGKHRNQPFATIPSDYFQYVLRTMDLDNDLRSSILNELSSRGDAVRAKLWGNDPAQKAVERSA